MPPRNASVNGDGFRMYAWPGGDTELNRKYNATEKSDLLSVTSIKTLAGIAFQIVNWQISNVLNLAMGTRRVTVIGPRGGVSEKLVKDGPFPGEFVRRMVESDGSNIDDNRRWLRAAAEHPRDVAAVRGSVVHKLIELDVPLDIVDEDLIRKYFALQWAEEKVKVKPDILDDDVNFVTNAMAQYWDMRANVPFVVIAREPQIYNLTAGYGGSGDVILWFLGHFETRVKPTLETSDGSTDPEIEVIFIPLPNANDDMRTTMQKRANKKLLTLAEIEAVGGTLCVGDWKTSKGIYCLGSATPVLTDDLRWVPAGNLKPGDGLWAFSEDRVMLGKGSRRWERSVVTRNEVKPAETLKVTLDNGDEIICTPDHPFLARRTSGGRKMIEGGAIWVTAESLRVGDTLPKYLTPWTEDPSKEAGWFAGLLDGEGCITSGRQLSFAQKEGVVAERARAFMREHGIRWTERVAPGAIQFRLRGDARQIAEILGRVRPVRLIRKFQPVEFQVAISQRARVISVEPAGQRMIASLTTSSKTYIGGGYGSHNTSHVVQTIAYMAGEFIALDGIIDERMSDILAAAALGMVIHIRPNKWAVEVFEFRQDVLRAFLGSLAYSRFLAINKTPDKLFIYSLSGVAEGTGDSEVIEDDGE